MAGNAGTGSWGRQKSTQAVLSRFVEMEKDKGTFIHISMHIFDVCALCTNNSLSIGNKKLGQGMVIILKYCGDHQSTSGVLMHRSQWRRAVACVIHKCADTLGPATAI